jgi:DNA sulfur modification protein DndD
MLLKRIKLTNFRCYLGECEIEFATDPKKNITIIHGENGVGKTALLNAILWTFFEKNTKGFKHEKVLLNHVAKKEGKKHCSVEIEFAQDGRNFLVHRSYNQSTQKSILKLWQIKDNGTYGPQENNPEYFIKTILPPEMADYFFFQGEGSSALDSKNKSGTLGPAIRNILGFKVPESLLETLSKIKKEVRRQIAANDKSGECAEIERRLSRHEQSQEDLIEKNEDINARNKKAEIDLKSTEDALSQIKNDDLEQLRKDEQRLNRELIAAKKSEKSYKEKKQKAIKQYAWAIFGADFAKQSLEFIDESVISGELPEPYNQQFIEKILTEKECICGICLEPGSTSWKKITDMLKSAANPVLQNRLLGINSQIQDIKSLSQSAPDLLNELVSSAAKNESAIESYEAELKRLSDKIKEIPESHISDLETKKQNLRRDISRNDRELGANNERLETLKSSIANCKNQLDAFSAKSNIFDALNVKSNFIDDMEKYIKEHLASSEEKIRISVLSEVNKILTKFSRHDYKIGISSEDFKISLLDTDENIVGQGDGLNLLLNLTITAALIKFAGHRKNVKDPILSSATVAPLVIDAPFGVLDESYRNVVVTNLPDYANQLVFFVSSSQWSEDMDEITFNRLGKEYCLVMEEASPQKDKKIDQIFIRGKQYTLSKYEQAKSRTSVMEVKL